MNLPGIFDVQAMAGIAVLALIVIQYIKNKLPENLIRWITVLVSIGVSFIWFYKEGAGYNYIVVIVNGAFAAFGSDTGYNFLSAKPDSPAFTLPAKAAEKEVPK
jgi:hypothetical protein